MKIKSPGKTATGIRRKLVLNRETLRELDRSQLQAAAGATVGDCDTGRTICWTACASNCIC